ncbi:MAG: tetratricopeptide repeat protein [Acidithiobacillus sp.]
MKPAFSILVLVLIGCTLSFHASATDIKAYRFEDDLAFDVDKAPASDRGKAIPIGGNTAYGSKFTEVNGMYTFILPVGWSWEPDEDNPNAIFFSGKSGTNYVECTVYPLNYWRGPRTLAELQATSEISVLDHYEKQLVKLRGWEKVDSRGFWSLGDGGRQPIKVPFWSANHIGGAGFYDTDAVVEAPANTFLIHCYSANPKVGEVAIKIAFRLAEGALVPAAGKTNVASKPASPASSATTRQKLAEALRLEKEGEVAKAVSIYKELAKADDPLAQLKLGMAYNDGKGVGKDKTQAAIWFRKSAAQGDVMAQGFLGLSYQTGEGVPKDKILAYMWFKLAKQEPLWAQMASQLGMGFTTSELGRANKLATECRASNYKNCP